MGQAAQLIDRIHRPPSRRAVWQRDWRRRVRDGASVCEIPGVMVELLLESRWLKPDEANDRHAITEALRAFANAAMKNR